MVFQIRAEIWIFKIYIYIYNCQYTRKKISLLQRKQQSDMSRSSEELTEPNRQRGCESYRK